VNEQRYTRQTNAPESSGSHSSGQPRREIITFAQSVPISTEQVAGLYVVVERELRAGRLWLLAGFPALASIVLTCRYAVSAGLRVCAHFDVPAGVLRAVGRLNIPVETLTPWRPKSQSRSSAAAQDYRPE
jgi:hypothetical protein